MGKLLPMWKNSQSKKNFINKSVYKKVLLYVHDKSFFPTKIKTQNFKKIPKPYTFLLELDDTM